MKKLLKRAAVAVLPQRTGNASCPPDPYYDYWCQNHYYYRRTCQTPPNCGPDTCGPWYFIGSC